MQGEFAIAYRATRRSYEVGRLMTALRHAAMLTLLVAVVAGFLFGRRALMWLPITLLAVTFTEWRGMYLLAGARRGLLAGFGSMFLPLSILRPCCGIDAKAMGTACCIMPSACWATGAVVGLGMALLLPKVRGDQRTQAALGLILGVTAVAVTRCSMLFLGEAVGLLGGMSAAISAAAMARGWLNRRRSFR
jgi:hypothetical protein